MNIKEQELIEQHLNEASSKDYSKLSTTELKDLLTIFKNVSRSAAKPVIGAINRELNTRVSEETRIAEAKVVPFKNLEQAWTRTGGDKAKQAKLIKKHDLKKIISTVRPGEIKLGVKNKLLGTTKAATAAGLDLDDQLIFITNNPLKIIYPKKSSRRPEGEEIEESVDIAAARLEKMVSLVLKENNLETIKFFIENSDIDLSTAPSKIREGYKSFDLSESAAAQRKLKTSNKLSSKEYEKFSKLKAFNDKDWKWNSKEGLYNRVNEEVELDEAKNITVRALRQMMFKLDSSAADKFRKELFKIDKQDSPATNAQIKKAKKIIGNRFGKDAFVQLESTDLDEASKSDIKKVLAAAKKAGADIKGNKIDFGAGSLIDVSIEKGKIKFDGGMSTGVEYFNNAKDAIMAFESTDLDEASTSDIKKVLDAGKKAGGKIKGNTIDFGMGAKIDVSLEKGKIKLDGGRDGVELFKNVKDALMAFEETQHVMEGE